MTAGAFNTPLTPVNRSPKQKVNKETLASNDTLAQMGLIDIENILSTNIRIYLLPKCTWNILQERSYMRPQYKSQ